MATVVGLLARGLWLLLAKAVAPAVLVACVLAFRWFTGAPLRPTWTGERLVTRPVRAVAQSSSTVAGVCLWLFPLVTAVVLAAVGVSLVAAVLVSRRRGGVVNRGPVRASVLVTGQVPALTGDPVGAAQPVREAEMTGVHR